MVDKTAEEFLIMNPLLQSNKDIYIWMDESAEGRKSAQRLFGYLLKRKIYVKGFAAKSSLLTGLKMYNKEVADIDELDQKNINIVFDAYFCGYSPLVASGEKEARIINPKIDRKEVIIWGAGITGEKVYKILMENGYQVKCFIDSNRELEGTLKYNVPVKEPASLEGNDEDVIIIEALEGWKSLDDSIREKKWRRFHFSLIDTMNHFTCNVEGTEKKLFGLSFFWMFHHFAGKKVYIYGNGTIEKEFSEYLRLLDYDFAGFLIDDSNQGDTSCQYIEEVLYEDNYYIWTYDRWKTDKLKELGLQCLKNWECNKAPWDITLSRREGLDINMGYTSLADSKYPGIMVYGDEKNEDYKIAVLGGSTTDGGLYPFPSWPELLREELGMQDVTIYNGGVSGYTSGQELIKLIRDVLPLKPDMIIVYDGANDLNVDTRHPFAFPYSKKVFHFAKNHLEKEDDLEFRQVVCEGISCGQERFDAWLSNIRTMHAIAAEYKIRFFSFCQPALSCKKGKTAEEKNILLSMPGGQADFWIKEYFREKLEQRKEIPDYIYNFTNIYDDITDVYMDICHVNEKGNRIAAAKIKEVIYETVLQDRNKQ